ncbi:MAG: hypothetical protein AAF518_19275, partial [Spirochaetota bacterium]
PVPSSNADTDKGFECKPTRRELATTQCEPTDFYMSHADNTEGTGMGITLIVILLSQSGYNRDLFTIQSSRQSENTIAQLVLPLDKDKLP